MAHDIRHPNGITQHVYGGPNARRPRRWRPSGMTVFIVLGLVAVWAAHLGGWR